MTQCHRIKFHGDIDHCVANKAVRSKQIAPKPTHTSSMPTLYAPLASTCEELVSLLDYIGDTRIGPTANLGHSPAQARYR